MSDSLSFRLNRFLIVGLFVLAAACAARGEGVPGIEELYRLDRLAMLRAGWGWPTSKGPA